MTPIFQLDARVLDQAKVAEGSFILSLEAPQIAERIQPGQFIQIRCVKKEAGKEFQNDPLLPRPFSIYRVRQKQVLDILYEVVGRGTERMAQAKKGDRLNVFGPLGDTFSYPAKSEISFLIGGGVGLAPFYDLAEALIDPKRGKQERGDVIVLLGARNRRKIFCEKEFKALGVRFEIATDDGSRGFKGFVTGLLEKKLQATSNKQQATRIYACGPKPMLRVISQISEKFELPCEISIDAHMPCGYGICFGCAVKVRVQGTGYRVEKDKKTTLHPTPSTLYPMTYKLACMDGPVFDAKGLVWE